MSKRNFRKTAAIGLAFIGLAGVGVASAATLDLNGGSQDLVQANTVAFSGNSCQADGSAILATFTLDGATPGTLSEAPAAFGYPSTDDAVRLTGIDAASCVDKIIKVALGDSGDAALGTEFEETLLATDTSFTLSLAAGGDFGAGAIDPDDIAKISVTIYDAP